MTTDYLIVGSGLSALVFGALMANAGKQVQVLESHEHPGGFGHTFTLGKKYTFNAQLHYVWDCGEGHTVNRVLRRLGLDQEITFERYHPDGFDHMHMPGYSLEIPSDSAQLIERLTKLFPEHAAPICGFLREVQKVRTGLKLLSPPVQPLNVLRHPSVAATTLRYLNSTLQAVFDNFNLPEGAQTLLALQWPDFLLPPNQLSFYAWVVLFTSYQEGAFYPTGHFEAIIKALVKTIESNGGKVFLNQEVVNFLVTNKTVTGVQAIHKDTHETHDFKADAIICNMDPKKAAKMIGLNKFSKAIRKQLDYDYSPSNFMAYCAVKDLDLRDYGFGKWNTFHTAQPNLNAAFEQMYEHNDFSQPSFAITTPTLLTNAQRDCPEDCQIIEFLTVANHGYFQALLSKSRKEYTQKKEEIFNRILDIVEEQYIPNFREHLVFSVTGSPTTNERFCN